MDQAIYLSHFFEKTVPIYGGGSKTIEITPEKSLSCGDSCNTFNFRLSNHMGTHIDSPSHFFNDAPNLCDYDPSFWFFKNIQIVPIDIKENFLIKKDQLLNKVNQNCELLILKTGFSSLKRASDEFGSHGPGVHAEVGSWLRKNYPSLRVIALDFISISSFQHRSEGRESHRTFLDPNGENNPILILEDLKLDSEINRLSEVVVLPLMFRDMDSAPCTVVGKI